MKEYWPFIVGVYGRLQIELIEMNLINENGSPKKRKELKRTDPVLLDGLYIYDSLANRVANLSTDEINSFANVTNEKVHKLFNENYQINNYILAMMLYRNFLQDFGTTFEKNLLLNKTIRNIDAFTESISDKDLVKHTHRVADNLWRQFNGKAQLDDEIRNKLFTKHERKTK